MNEKELSLRRIVRELDRVVVAYSGGIDSTLLAVIAGAELGDRAMAVTAVSPSLPHADSEEAQSLAKQFNFAHVRLFAQQSGFLPRNNGNHLNWTLATQAAYVTAFKSCSA